MMEHTKQRERQQQTTSASSQDTVRDARHELSQKEMRRRYLEQKRRLFKSN